MNRIYFLISLFLITLFFMGCSSQKQIVQDEKVQDSFLTSADDKQKALNHFINGCTAEAKGDFASAILEFQDALRLNPDAGVYYALAKNYLMINKLPLSLQHAKKAVEMEPEKIEYLELLSDVYFSARLQDSSVVVLNKIIKIDSSNVSAHYKLARIYENGKPLQAIITYNKLLELTGAQWDVLLRVAELYEKLGSLEKAAASIEKMRAIDPGNSALDKMLIEFYARSKEFDKAIEVTSDLLELTPDDVGLHELKAQVLIEKGDWEAAAIEYNYLLAQPQLPLDMKIKIGTAYFNRALSDSTIMPMAKNLFETLDRDTTDWQVKIFLGAIAMSEGNDSAAIKYFKIATDLAPWNAEAWIRLGGLYFDNQKYEEAIKVTSEAVKQFPDDYTINLILGFSYSQTEKHEDAYSFLKKAVELNPSDVNALSAFGYTLNQLKQSDEAIKYLNLALSIQPDNVNLLGTLGLIYNAIKKYAECDSVYSKALKLEPDNALVNNNYAYSLSERGERLDDALEMVKKSIDAEPYNSSYLDTIGWVYFKLGKYEPAKENIEKAIKVGGEKAVMIEHLGDVVFKMGAKDEAMKLWQKALDLDNGNKELQLKIETGEI